MLKIEPIKLLRGCHPSTGQTGQGCFLNVCSYLQGDTKITDKPSSVAPSLRGVFIALNDAMLSDSVRQRLLPFIPRAMQTTQRMSDNDQCELIYRLAIALEGVLPKRVRPAYVVDAVCSALSRGGPEFGGDHLVKFIATAIQYAGTHKVEVWPDLEVMDYVSGLKAPPTIQVQRKPEYEHVFDSLLAVLDKYLPLDPDVSPEVEQRAADLVTARAAWGDRPVPKLTPAYGVYDGSSIISSKTVKEIASLLADFDAAKHEHVLFGVDFAAFVPDETVVIKKPQLLKQPAYTSLLPKFKAPKTLGKKNFAFL